MPTLAQRIETLEAAVAELRDPIALAASKDDHTLAKRLLELESQYAELKQSIAVTREEHAATQKLIIQHDAQIAEVDNHLHGVENDLTTAVNEASDHEQRITSLENTRANPNFTIQTPDTGGLH